MCQRGKARPDYGTNLNLNRKVLDFIKSDSLVKTRFEEVPAI